MYGYVDEMFYTFYDENKTAVLQEVPDIQKNIKELTNIFGYMNLR